MGTVQFFAHMHGCTARAMSHIDPVMFDCKVLENFSCQAAFMV